MSAYIGDYLPRLRQRARMFKLLSGVAAVVAGSAYPVMAAVTGAWPVGPQIIGMVAGSASSVLVLAGLPWLGYLNAARQSERALYLHGTELTVTGLGKKEPDTFDLTRTRAEVLLIGGTDRYAPRSGSGPVGQLTLQGRLHQLKHRPRTNRQKFVVPHHPVLVLFREDGHAFPIELCYVVSGQLRDSDEIIALERAMQFATDPAIQRAAGQLRTVAAWRQLPQITDADPQAIPVTPSDYPHDAPVVPTPVRAGTPSPQIHLVPELPTG